MAERRDFGTIRRLPSGRYQATFIGPDLARRKAPVAFEVKDSAIVWLHNEKKLMEQAATDNERWLSPVERAEEAAAGRAGGSCSASTRRGGSTRRNSKGEPLRALTQKDYRQVLATYLDSTVGTRPIERITRAAAGRDDLKWHDPRHTGATTASRLGATTAELHARLGHSTSVAAQLYQHAAKDRDRQIAERLSHVLAEQG